MLPLLGRPHSRLAVAIEAKLHLESLALASAKIAFVYFIAIYRGLTSVLLKGDNTDISTG